MMVQFWEDIGMKMSMELHVVRRRSLRAKQNTSLLEKDLAQVLKDE